MTKKQVRILAIDIETAPHTAHVWSLFKQTVSLSQLMDTGRVLCFAWKWIGEGGPVHYISERGDRSDMLMKAYELLDQADIVVTYNGKKFDIPTLNKEFFEKGFSPPAPYKQVDLYRTARSRFRFASNKMDHLAKQLGIKTKLRHSGHDLWVQCMANNEKAWLKMERYNKRDVLILCKLYEKMLPWIVGHPNVALFNEPPTDKITCPSCGSTKIHSRGFATAKSYTYRRYHCASCGSWSKGNRREKDTHVPEVTSHA